MKKIKAEEFIRSLKLGVKTHQQVKADIDLITNSSAIIQYTQLEAFKLGMIYAGVFDDIS